jgi:Ca2+-binding RTX toxin-like protein
MTMAKPTGVGSAGKGPNSNEEKVNPALDRPGIRPWDEDFKNPEEESDIPEIGPKTGNNNFFDLAAFFKEKIMTMAKPIWAGWSENGKFNSALDRSWLVTVEDEDEIVFENQGSLEDQVGEFVGTKSNDFLYIDKELGQNAVYSKSQPVIDGRGAADHIIMMEDAQIEDDFFTKMESVTVLKLGDGKGLIKGDVYEATGSLVVLGEKAQAAGIREVTGGPGDDTIIFIGSIVGEEGEEGEATIIYDGVDVLVEGGDGDDIITTAGGNDTIDGGAGDDTIDAGAGDDIIIGGAGADTMTGGAGNNIFVWLAGDMAGTNEDHPDYSENEEVIAKFDLITDFKLFKEPVDLEQEPDDYDQLDFRELLDDLGYDFENLYFYESENDTIIAIADTDSHTNIVTLQGVSLDSFDANASIVGYDIV